MQRRNLKRGTIGASPSPRTSNKNGSNGIRPQRKTNNRSPLLYLFAGVFGVALLVVMLALSFLPDPNRSSEQSAHGNLKKKPKLPQQVTPLRQKVVEEPAAEVRTVKEDADDVEYYMVFSTACSAFQDWQSYVFFYYAMKVKQPGHVIRIASGCPDEKIEALKQIHEERIKPMSDKFHVHFTPDFAGKGTKDHYKYNNKPFGLRHFLENFLGYPDKKDAEDAIVMIVDPDQMLLKPITNDFSNTNVIWRKGPAEQQGLREPRTKVEHGSPIAQQYAFGPQPFMQLNLTNVAGENSPALKVTREEAAAYYPAGPPYLATVRDMYTIAFHWTEFMPKVHKEYPELLGEMFGYCIAAAHAGLPHQIAQSFMVSDPDSGAEGWPMIEAYPTEKLCDQNTIPTENLPQVFHYCQRYWLGKWFIGKYRLDVNFISCEAPLLTVPPDDVGLQYDYYIAPGGKPYGEKKPINPKGIKRHTWSLCWMIKALNEVAIYFKKNHCDETANYEETYVFGPNRTEYDSKMDMWAEHHKKPEK